MTTIQRQRVEWSGFAGSPGISTFYFTDAASHQAALRTFLQSIRSLLPNTVTLNVQSGGDTFVVETGQLSGGWVGVGGDAILGIQGGPYAAPSGFEVRWDSNSVLFGRRGRGRTFFVPCAANALDIDGTLTSGAVLSVGNGARTLVAAVPANMQLWSRPRKATPAWTDVRGVLHPAKTARAGYIQPVATATVPDKAVVLRSRRD